MSSKTLVLGNGPCALQTAKLLANQGLGVMVANREQSLACPEELVQAVSNNPAVELLMGYRLETLTRQVGQFEACLVKSGAPERRLVSSIVVAEENNRVSNAALYGLQSNARTLEVNGVDYCLTPDLFVVDETVIPSGYLSELARVMQLDTDQLGFVQTENVHRLTVSTNCRGIFAVGPSRAVMSAADAAVDAANAVEAVIRLQSGAPDIPSYRAEIDTGQCIACLTCFRLCPYKAVLRGHRMSVLTDACEGCGICAAECPRGAIAM
ncbi:MAG: 4Fe-4S binding protein, partial [Desulfobacterales bacterium]